MSILFFLILALLVLAFPREALALFLLALAACVAGFVLLVAFALVGSIH
jgi:hypothetical protein